MKLYEINQAIQDLLEQLVDPETGEILEDSEEIMEQLDTLEMDRKNVLEYLAKIVLNARSEAAVLKAEEDRLRARRQKLENTDKKILSILDRECQGQKTNLGVATVSYRKTSSVNVNDVNDAYLWMVEHECYDCFKLPDPQISKTAVKKLISKGITVPGCELVEKLSCSLK